MADFKSVIAKLSDNGKSTMYINGVKNFQSRKDHDELTTRIESGLGRKVIFGEAVLFTIIIDRDEFDRINKEVDAVN
ncbi:hypothetical protein [Brevibacillus laterosporus]|uniref:hypothetical protein n=1 Tax=Brevibacillus laterosporus TaxID=1465 RepID=UPI002E1B00CC|nr:hypothetical protein [Brevibacillus laterosporus]MED1667227.1 hypothetical protein [Brevibacillus laterosporus]MED1719705.1 hypothetical protein [Brevibacillus laterosporus]